MTQSRLLATSLVGLTLLGSLLGCDSSQTPTAGQPNAQSSQAKVSNVARGSIPFVEGYAQGCEVARREHKPMLVFFTAAWCQYCHQMADDAFTQSQVVNLSQNFVCVLVDADVEPQVCRWFNIRGYPTVQFLTSAGAPLHRVMGKRPGPQFIVDMQTALQAVARAESRGSIMR